VYDYVVGAPADQIVMHVDMDAFYASVELRNRPELRGRPVVVGGSPRGVVLSANYQARALGVRSGVSSAQARRLAPNAVFLPPDFDAYTAVSKAIVEVFGSVSSVVESASIDEAYLDITGSVRMFGPPAELGEYVRAVVADEQQITCSVGIAPTKVVAKVASKQAKPDGLIEVLPERVTDFLHPLPLEAMWGIGPATAGKLHRLGVRTIGDLAHTPVAGLRRAFGPHAGAMLVNLAWGRDGRRVVGRVPERSVGSQGTLGRDTDDPRVVRRELLRMADRTCRRMRRAGLVGRTVVLSVRFADFSELTRSATVATFTDTTEEVYAEAVALYERLGLDRARVRRVGVRVEGVVDGQRAARQPRLTDPELGWPEADHAVDAALAKFGPGAVRRAVLTEDGPPASPAEVSEWRRGG
jgi:DNA polymerase-4